MTQWARAPQERSQLVLFADRLEDAVPAGHPVRLLDELLSSLSWTAWEARYHGRLGQPPIHPRILAGVLLYGFLRRIRSSRQLEEALQMRIDFRWLASGRSIDHTTLSEFRRTRGKELQELFVQVGLLARRLELLPLEQLAFDGTRIRANNRVRGTRTPVRLQELQAELAQRYAADEAQAQAEEAREGESFTLATDALTAPPEHGPRQAKYAAAIAELQRALAAQEKLPERLPTTDPQSRLLPNKDGGYAPNYTPLATVDVDSGLIVAVDVIARIHEDPHLLPALEQVQTQFALPQLPGQVLADSMMCTNANLALLHEQGVTLYSPLPAPPATDNPALRDDPQQPVAEADWPRLPLAAVSAKGSRQQQQLSKEAFVYDAQRDCYWCPQGQALTLRHTTSEPYATGQVTRQRYFAEEQSCTDCPLRSRCLGPTSKRRQVSRNQHEALRARHAQHMATPEAQAKYARRAAVGERPFAVIKQQFGLRQFLLRGLAGVRLEWTWASVAFNLQHLLFSLRGRAGPHFTTIPTLTALSA